MKNARKNEVSDRRAASADAKTALLNAYRAARTVAEPARMARQAERAAIATAREERRVERERLKLEEQKRIETEATARQAAVEAAAVAETEARAIAENPRIAQGSKMRRCGRTTATGAMPIARQDKDSFCCHPTAWRCHSRDTQNEREPDGTGYE